MRADWPSVAPEWRNTATGRPSSCGDSMWRKKPWGDRDRWVKRTLTDRQTSATSVNSTPFPFFPFTSFLLWWIDLLLVSHLSKSILKRKKDDSVDNPVRSLRPRLFSSHAFSIAADDVLWMRVRNIRVTNPAWPLPSLSPCRPSFLRS